MKETYKSILAAILIAIGAIVLLKAPQPLGAILFAFGLLTICKLGYNLFTGKCGFIVYEDTKKIYLLYLLDILWVNLLSGYIIGVLVGLADKDLKTKALTKVSSWSNNYYSLFVASVLCGAIMYLAVELFKQGTVLGIIFGVPIFILSGFHHCIANIIFLGISLTFSFKIVIMIIGNFIGSIVISYLEKKGAVNN